MDPAIRATLPGVGARRQRLSRACRAVNGKRTMNRSEEHEKDDGTRGIGDGDVGGGTCGGGVVVMSAQGRTIGLDPKTGA